MSVSRKARVRKQRLRKQKELNNYKNNFTFNRTKKYYGTSLYFFNMFLNIFEESNKMLFNQFLYPNSYKKFNVWSFTL